MRARQANVKRDARAGGSRRYRRRCLDGELGRRGGEALEQFRGLQPQRRRRNALLDAAAGE